MIAVALSLPNGDASAQLMINKGALIYTKTGSIVQINGAYQNSSGTIKDSGIVTITTDFTNSTGAIAGGAGIYNIGGNYTNDATFQQETGTVNLNGTSNQNVGGAVTTTFYDLQFNGGGTKTLTKKEIVDSNCYFTNGIAITTQTNVLNFTTKGNWVNNSGMPSGPNISHVSGPCEKDMNTTNEFIFPIGKSGRANTVALTPTTATPTTYRTEYFWQKYVNTTSMIAPLVRVSGVHYWHADIVSGGADAKIRLFWIPGDYQNVQMPTPSSLVVARWNIGLTAWQSEGVDVGGLSPGATFNSGWLRSPSLVSAKYGTASINQPFTLGSTTLDNTLPVELGGFNVKQVQNHVDLDWYTFSEIQNLGFEIERARDGDFSATKIKSYADDTALVAKSPYGADYASTDNDHLSAGRYRYDLYQIDQNGIRTRVSSRFLDFSPVAMPSSNQFSVYPNPASSGATVEVRLPNDEHFAVRVFDVTGKLLVSLLNLDLGAGDHLLPMDVSLLPAGAYTVEVMAGSERMTRHIIVKH